MLAGSTTTSCRAFALLALFWAPAAARAAESDKVVSPKIPIAQSWTIDLKEPVSAPPVMDNERAYVAFSSGHLAAIELKDHSELWRIDKQVKSPMAAAGGMLFVSAGGAIEALRGADHASVWTLPRVTTTAPLVAADDRLIAVTDSELLAIGARDGRVIWRRPLGGVQIAPAIDGDRVYTGADDGRLAVFALSDGSDVWEAFVPDGVTALTAFRGVAYVGAGDKHFYCYKDGKQDWPVRVGSIVEGPIAVDDERVYFTARDNVVRGLDRSRGTQRWIQPIRSRPIDGVIVRGHIVFVPTPSRELPMLFVGNGKPSGALALPGDMLRDIPPDIEETSDGVRIVAVTGGLTNEWRLSLFASTGEPALVPVADALPDIGAYLHTDPALQPMGKVLDWLVLGDPPLLPLDAIGFPLVLQDPPLEPLTTFPGLQLRPLSPQLPPRRGGSRPGG